MKITSIKNQLIQELIEDDCVRTKNFVKFDPEINDKTISFSTRTT